MQWRRREAGHVPSFLVTHEFFRRPAFGRHHPLATGRQAAVQDLIEVLGWRDPALTRVPELPGRAVLERFHASGYLDALAAADAAGMATADMRARYNLGTMECPIFPGLWDRARATVGGSMLAAELVLGGGVAFHPTGGTHHGMRSRASGFCYLNDPVFAILRLLDGGLGKVLHVDLDAHHGDGVEAAFTDDPRVGLLSIHEDGRWPGTGRPEDTHGGRALNVPVPRGINDSEYALVLERLVYPFVRRAEPDAIVILLGADGLAGDPLSGMRLSNGALWKACRTLIAMAPRVVILGGGGYNPWTTARLWAGMWGILAGRDISGELPHAAQAVLAGLECDLVDDEDCDPVWLTTLIDPPNTGPIRQEMWALVETHPLRAASGV
jgi:acetoin utilization protein AcuC